MLNLLKWNSLDFLHRYAWIFIIAAASLAATAVIPNGAGTIYTVLYGFAILLGFLFFLSALFFALYQSFDWLRHSSALLELSLPAAAWKLLLSRVIIAVVINTVACLGICILILLIGKNHSGGIEPINADHLNALAGLVVLLILVDMTILFSYLIARSIGLFRLQAAFITALLASILLILIIVFCVYIMAWTHMVMLMAHSITPPMIGSNVPDTLLQNFRVSALIPGLAACIWITFLEYLGSCLLLKYRIQAE